MKEKDIELLTRNELPESVRAAIAERLVSNEDRFLDRELEIQKLSLEKKRLVWNTPLIAALAGLLTLTVTFFFDRIAGRDETSYTIAIEQIRQELKASEARLQQQLDADTADSAARLEASAREREFQYDIVRSELADDSKTNAERADVLLFLVRAGIVKSLDRDGLIAMIAEQKQNPDQIIIPRLARELTSLPSTVVGHLFRITLSARGQSGTVANLILNIENITEDSILLAFDSVSRSSIIDNNGNVCSLIHVIGMPQMDCARSSTSRGFTQLSSGASLSMELQYNCAEPLNLEKIHMSAGFCLVEDGNLQSYGISFADR